MGIPDTPPTSGDAELAIISLLQNGLDEDWGVRVSTWRPGMPYTPPFVGVRDLSDITKPESVDNTLDSEPHLVELRIFADTENRRANLVLAVKAIIRAANESPGQGYSFMKKVGARNLDDLSLAEKIYQTAITITVTRYDTGDG